MLLQKSKENIIKILAFKGNLHFAVGRLMGAGALWPRYLNAAYLSPLMLRCHCPRHLSGGWQEQLLYTRTAGTRKVQGKMKQG